MKDKRWLGWAAAPLAVALALVAGLFVSRQAAATMNFSSGTLTGPFESYWKANGGLARFGMPLTGVFTTYDGFAAQWFERAVLTYDPHAAASDSVHTQQLGWVVMADRCSQAPFAQVSASGSGQYFPVTGHNLSGAFLAYWKGHNGLAWYGYPLSEPFTERLGDGKDYLVQYFEQARLELHANNDVQVGLLGAELLAKQGGAAAYASLPVPAFYPASGTPASTAHGHRLGHAGDYSWVAGRVAGLNVSAGGPLSDRPQGPAQVLANAAPVLYPPVVVEDPTPLPNGIIVGHAVHGDTSPPLRDIQPRPITPQCNPLAAEVFLPTGHGWDASRVKDGDYVVLYGHLATPGEVSGMGDKGRPYVVDRMVVAP